MGCIWPLVDNMSLKIFGLVVQQSHRIKSEDTGYFHSIYENGLSLENDGTDKPIEHWC